MDITKVERRMFLAELNAEMLDRNITQKELGERLGIAKSRISLWLSGSCGMSVDNLIRLTATIRDWSLSEEDGPLLEEPEAQYGEPKPTLGHLIKTNLRQKGITQKELAYRVGTSQSRISEYIRGAVIPTLGVAARICRELQINEGEFVEACSRL